MSNTDIRKLLDILKDENKVLNELIEENKRLNSTFLNETGKEYVDALTEKTKDLQKKLQENINEVNKNLKIKIEDSSEIFDVLSKNIEISRKKQKEYNDEIEKYNETLKNLNKDIPEQAEKIKQIEEEQLKLVNLLYEEEERVKKINDSRDELEENSLKYYRSANKEQKELNRQQLEGYTILDHYSEKWEQSSRALRKGFDEIAKGGKKAFDAVVKTLEPWSKANHEAMAYAKTMGMSQKTADKYLKDTVSWASKNNIGVLFNKSTDELIKMQGKYSEVLGRNIKLTNEQKKDMLAMESILGEDLMMNIANNLENFGLGMSDSADFVKKTIDQATKSGVVASKLTKTVAENIKMAQNYTFKNGLDGLTSMAKKAIQLKTDLSLVNGFLEKTSTVEGAITTGANLQVLGGTYAMGSDPLSMMNESLTNMEGLFDRAVGMAKGKVFYNDKTENFEMGAMDRYLMKQAATVMGIDPSKLIDVAFRQASLGKIESQAKLNSNIAGDTEMMDLVKNLATWNKGKAMINIGGKDVEVSKLKATDKEVLEQMQRTDSENLQEMAINLRSMNNIMSGTAKEKDNEQADLLKGIGNGLNNVLRNSTGLLNSFAKIGAWYNAINGSWVLLSGILGVTSGIWRTMIGMQNLGGFFNGQGGGVNSPVVGNKSRQLFGGLKKGDFKGGFRQNIVTGSKGKKYIDLGGGKLRPLDGGNDIAAGRVKITSQTRQLTNLGKMASKSLKIGGVTSVVGAGLSLGADMLSGDFAKDQETSWQNAAGVGIGAGLGAAIGSFILPGVGTWVGGMIGSALGEMTAAGISKWQKRDRAEVRDNIAAELSSVDSELAKVFVGNDAIQGNYNKKDLKRIKNAISDGNLTEGEISNSLRKKMKANNDLERLQKHGIGVYVEMAKGGKLSGLSHKEGGMPILGSNIAVEGGEFVINKKSAEKHHNLLTKINNDTNITPIEPLGKQMTVINNYYNQPQNNNNGKIEIQPISINLSGNIKLDSGNGNTLDISNEILRNPNLITKLTEMISRELNTITNGAFNKEKYIQKFA